MHCIVKSYYRIRNSYNQSNIHDGYSKQSLRPFSKTNGEIIKHKTHLNNVHAYIDKLLKKKQTRLSNDGTMIYNVTGNGTTEIISHEINFTSCLFPLLSELPFLKMETSESSM